MNGGVERVGETVLEHPAQSGVGEQGLYPFYLFFYGGRGKQPFLRAITGILYAGIVLWHGLYMNGYRMGINGSADDSQP